MTLPIEPPYLPMEAETVAALPAGAEWEYEPKWDGFRCLAFRDAAHVDLQSKSAKPLGRYFPELVAELRALSARRFVLDGEIAVPVDGRLSFDELLLRIHPAASRVRKLAEAHPALLIAFDLLVDERGRRLADQPLAARRTRLEAFAAKYFRDRRVVLSPATRVLPEAQDWFQTVGGNLDGVIAKRLDLPYQSGLRGGMVKLKKLRTADCVVGGFRYATARREVGSLLLGLYGDDGLLHHVGFTSGIRAAERKGLTRTLQKLRRPPGFTGRAPGGPSRWSTERTGAWEPLAPERVVEVQYDHFTGGRFRHGTRLLRWRPDKDPRQCTFAQVETGASAALLPL